MATLVVDRRTAVPDLEPARIKPVKWWAAGGVIVLSLMAISIGRWLLGGHATPTPVGSSHVPTLILVSIRIHEIVFPAIAVFTFYWTIVRPWRRERRLTADGSPNAQLTKVWSSIGTRTSRLFAIAVRSTLVRMSLGSQDFRSIYCASVTGSSTGAAFACLAITSTAWYPPKELVKPGEKSAFLVSSPTTERFQKYPVVESAGGIRATNRLTSSTMDSKANLDSPQTPFLMPIWLPVNSSDVSSKRRGRVEQDIVTVSRRLERTARIGR